MKGIMVNLTSCLCHHAVLLPQLRDTPLPHVPTCNLTFYVCFVVALGFLKLQVMTPNQKYNPPIAVAYGGKIVQVILTTVFCSD